MVLEGKQTSDNDNLVYNNQLYKVEVQGNTWGTVLQAANERQGLWYKVLVHVRDRKKGC